jgi:hypothetical protein
MTSDKIPIRKRLIPTEVEREILSEDSHSSIWSITDKITKDLT